MVDLRLAQTSGWCAGVALGHDAGRDGEGSGGGQCRAGELGEGLAKHLCEWVLEEEGSVSCACGSWSRVSWVVVGHTLLQLTRWCGGVS